MERAGVRSLASAAETEGAPKRSPLSRISFGHVVMILAGLLAVILNLMVLRGGTAEELVAVAARDLPAGTRLSEADLRFVPAPIDGDLANRFVSQPAASELVGLVVTRGVADGEPVFHSDLRPEGAPGAGRAMSIPVEPAHAVGGALQRGDQVDVIGVRDSVATYLASGIEVLAVPDVAGSGLSAATRSFSVTVAVDDAQAIAIAAMLDGGDVHIVRSTGAPRPTPPATDGGEEPTEP